jgi:cytochrome o ubiquinol oxidase subunit II
MKRRRIKIAALLFICIGIGVATLMYLLYHPLPVLDPSGVIARKQRDLLMISTSLMLLVVIPVFFMVWFFAQKYKAEKEHPDYAPDWGHSAFAEMIWWGVPCLIVIVLAILTFISTHDLDPYRPIEGDSDPLEIQVVALQWKWLFIYPEQKIASVNFFQIPVNQPVHFEITADAPMNSFWIPALSGQIFAMPRMRTELHILADELGEYFGSSANISGTGFAGMTFVVKASEQQEFDEWVKAVRETSGQLTFDEYLRLAVPSSYTPVITYALEAEKLFDRVLKLNMPTMSSEHAR